GRGGVAAAGGDRRRGGRAGADGRGGAVVDRAVAGAVEAHRPGVAGGGGGQRPVAVIGEPAAVAGGRGAADAEGVGEPGHRRPVEGRAGDVPGGGVTGQAGQVAG